MIGGMKVSARTIAALHELVTGDSKLTRYRSGPELVRLFNDYGANDVYGQGFPSRWRYAEGEIERLNDTPALATLICEVLHPREFGDADLDQQAAYEHLNARLKYDGYEVALDGGRPRIRDLEGSSVEFKHPFEGSDDEGHVFIDEQLSKCEQKVRQGDYDGAVTNARSLIEAVLLEIERASDAAAPPYDGDLLKLYKRVQKQLDLDPARPDVEGAIKQVLTGLVSIVGGIAGMSNKMGDRHARTYKPGKRHAVLLVNSAKTLANFLFETHSARAASAV